MEPTPRASKSKCCSIDCIQGIAACFFNLFGHNGYYAGKIFCRSGASLARQRVGMPAVPASQSYLRRAKQSRHPITNDRYCACRWPAMPIWKRFPPRFRVWQITRSSRRGFHPCPSPSKARLKAVTVYGKSCHCYQNARSVKTWIGGSKIGVVAEICPQ